MRADLDAMARVLRPVSRAQLRAEGEAAIAAAYAEKSVPVHPENGAACTDLAFQKEFWAEQVSTQHRLDIEHRMVA